MTVELKMRIAHKLHISESAQTVSGMSSSVGPASEIKKEKNKRMRGQVFIKVRKSK